MTENKDMLKLLYKSIPDIKKETNDYSKVQFLELLTLEKNLKPKKKIRKGLMKYIDSKIRAICNTGGKAGNGSDESKRLEWMGKNINNNTDWGNKFKKDYKLFYKKEIKNIKIIGGRGKHYDFLITHTDGTEYKCEEKGNKDEYDLQKSKKPWQKAVQRYNGLAKWADFICKLYAILWYNKIVSNNEINKKIGNILDIPSFDEWWCDCTSTDPKTEWGKGNKNNVKNKWKNGKKKISLNGKNGVPIDGRELIIDEFKEKFTEDIKEKLKQLIKEKLNEIMNEKDIWITTCGQLPDINYKFWNKFEPEKIEDIKIKYNKGSDIIFECIVENKKDNFECYLRFGKGCGFSNLRFDIR